MTTILVIGAVHLFAMFAGVGLIALVAINDDSDPGPGGDGRGDGGVGPRPTPRPGGPTLPRSRPWPKRLRGPSPLPRRPALRQRRGDRSHPAPARTPH